MSRCLALVMIAITSLAMFNCLVEREEGVILLNNRNFQDEVAKHNVLVIEFYSTDCKHCKEFHPEYIKLTKKLAGLNPPIFTSKVEVDQNKDLTIKFGVTTVPQVWVLIKGLGPVRYPGELKVDEIFVFVEYQNIKGNEEITENQVDDLMISNSRGFLFLGKDTEKFMNYDIKSKVYFDQNFNYCESQACLDRFKAKNGDIIAFKNKGRTIKKFSKPTYTYQEVDKFIIQNMLNLVEKATNFHAVDHIFENKVPGLVILMNEDYSSESYYNYRKWAFNAIKKKKGSIYGVIASQGFRDEYKVATFLGVGPLQYPKVFIVDFSKGTYNKFRLTDITTEINQETIADFVNKWEKNELKVYRRSLPQPEANDGKLTFVVRDNFKEVVLDNDKDVFLYIFNPMDKNSQGIAKSIENEVISKLKVNESSNPNLIFVALNGVENEVEELDDKIRSYPQYMLYPGNNKKKYFIYQTRSSEEMPNAEDLCDFISNHSHHTVEREDL